MSAPIDIPLDVIEEAKRLKNEGLTWYRIGVELGFHHDTIHRRVEPSWGGHLSQTKRDQRFKNATSVRREPVKPLSERMSEYAQICAVPRSIGSILLGDPLPGRSALDRMEQQ